MREEIYNTKSLLSKGLATFRRKKKGLTTTVYYQTLNSLTSFKYIKE